MTKRQIESRIKREASQVDIPDLKQQILAQVPNRKVVVKSEKKPFNLAIRLSYIMTILIVAVVAFLLINSKGAPGGIIGDNNTPSTLTKVVGNVERAYAKQAITLAGFATEDISGQAVSSIVTLSDEDFIDYDNIAERINEYFNLVSSMIDEAECSIEVLEDDIYQYKLTAKYKVLNDWIETIIYYNEEAIDEKYKDEIDLDEVETKISGIIVQEGKRNEFFGTKEIEEDEVEVELTLKMNDEEYLKVSHEKESDEEDLKFEFYKGRPDKENHPYKEFNVDIEEDKETGRKDVKVEFKHHDNDEEDFNIDFFFDKDGKIDIKYEDKKNGTHEGIKVDEDDEHKDHFKYDFGEGKGQSSVKKPHGDYDRDDDDREDDDRDDHGPRYF